LKGGPQDIDILHWTGRTALELIGQSGLGMCHDQFLCDFLMCFDLGYSFDNLDDGPPNEYSIALKDLLFVFSIRIYPASTDSHLILLITYRPTLFNLSVARLLIPYVGNLGPPGIRRFLVKLLPFSNVQKLCKMIDIMDKTSTEIFQSKKVALEQGDEALLKQVGHGKDIMSILCM
jgi:hypothetical protein